LRQAIDIFGCGTHRIAVVDGEGKLKGILSQSDVVRFVRNIVSRIHYLIMNLINFCSLKISKFPDLGDVLNKTVSYYFSP
jgi:hypothetical protein